MSTSATWIEPLLERKLLVLCGAGREGKTTTSAALANQAARRGRRVLVMTIDPARRLADSLGLAELGNAETPIDLESLGEPGRPVQGSLHAMMLDTRAAFRDMLVRLLDGAEQVERALTNRLSALILQQLAGVQEYLAGEKVYDTTESGRYDLVVLDTPPSRNALDFLDSPERFAWLMDERIMRWFLPAVGPDGQRVGLIRRLLSSSSNVVKRILARVFGSELVEEIEAFFQVMAGMSKEIRRRSVEVTRLMQSAETAFMLVTSTSELGLRDALFFHAEIRRRHLPFAGFVVNRVQPGVASHLAAEPLGESLRAEASALLAGPPGLGAGAAAEAGDRVADLKAVITALQRNARAADLQARHDRRRIEGLLDAARCDVPPALIPLLPDEVYDLRSLRRVGAYLLGSA